MPAGPRPGSSPVQWLPSTNTAMIRLDQAGHVAPRAVDSGTEKAFEARRFQVPINDQHALSPARQEGCNIGERHRLADPTLVGVEGAD